MGAKKIYGLDISDSMIEAARKNLTELGCIDKFELICADVFDHDFKLPEKVDCVILSYTVSTFINNYEMLSSIIKQCSLQVKPDGYVMVAEFHWMVMPCDNFFFGSYTR